MQTVTKRRSGYTNITQNRRQIKKVTRDKEGHYISVKGSVQQDNTTIINIYVPDHRSSKYMKQILTELKGGIDSSITIVGDFNISYSIMDRTTKQKITTETKDLNNTINQLINRHTYIKVLARAIRQEKGKKASK